MHNMLYSNGRLLVKMEGYYYLYSKVTFNVAQACSLVQHKFMKDTAAYGEAIELTKSKRLARAPHIHSRLSEPKLSAV